MPYLTYAEYIEFGFEEIEETEFERLVKKASDVIDGVTRFFYILMTSKKILNGAALNSKGDSCTN